MGALDPILAARLRRLDDAGLRRRLRPLQPVDGTRVVAGAGRSLRSFASNDYLGLSTHPALRAAGTRAWGQAGSGAGASRLVSGSLTPHHELEAALAAFKRTPAAVSFANGYATALGTLPALVGPGDFILLDRLAHACLVDAARLSGARLRVFRHNDLADLERLLRWTAAQRAGTGTSGASEGQALIVTESVFSMDGDLAPLRGIVELKERYEAWLMVDEAHATGVIGPNGRGWIEELGLTDRVEVTMGTLGKALGAAGGFVAGSGTLCDFLVNRARSFVFSTAPPPAVVAAAQAAVEVVGSAEGAVLIRQLWQRIAQMHGGLVALGWPLPPPASPILPLIVGDEAAAMRLSDALREEGFLVPGIRHPTVARGRARLRITVSAAHTAADIEALLSALRRCLDLTGVRPA